ncbi:hypothetical protein CPAV1605_789 [seawater metagenome]|uniref:Uncharacterized protein n=1 Tax=seawater metagenome TaxID=1561972 RepID=A0A5E8CK70_9ZZZZ
MLLKIIICIILFIGILLLYLIYYCLEKRNTIKIEKKINFKNNIIIGEKDIHKLCKEYLTSIFSDDQLLVSYNKKFNYCEKLNKLIRSYPNSNKYFLFKIINGLHLDENSYFINTEQLSIPYWLNYIRELKKMHSQLKFLDYSYQNVRILKEIGIQSKYFPYNEYKPEIFNFKKVYDVAIIGLDLKNKKKQNSRRNKIYNLLIQKGVKVNNICGFNFDDRDIDLFQHKILLNIHFDENYIIYEEIRCTRCTLNNIIVITEESDNLSEYMYYEKIIEVKYEKIVDKTIEVLENYNHYYKKLFN